MKLIRSFSYTFPAKLLSLLLLFVSRILMARILGPADTGSLGNALNVTTIISRWGTLGIAPAAQFTGSKYPLQKNTLFVYVIFLSVLLGAVNLLVLGYFKDDLLSWQFQADSSGQLAYLRFITWLPVIILSMTLPVFLLGTGQIIKYSFTQFVPVSVQASVLAIAYVQSGSIDSVISAQLICWFATVIIALLLIDYKHFTFQFNPALLLIFISYSLKAWPQVILQFGIARFAILIGSQYVSDKNLGYYILASNMSESFQIINTSVTPLLFNRIAAQGPDMQLLARSVRLSNLFLLIVFSIVLLIGKPVFLLLFGAEFEPSWPLLLFLLISVFFHGVVRLCLNYLAALGKHRIVSGIQLLELLLLLILSRFLCPVFGVPGLCYASICASAGACMFSMAALRKLDNENFKIHSFFIFSTADIHFLHQALKNIRKN